MNSTVVAAHRLLIVDDEPAQLQTLSDIFADDGFEVCGCATFDQALDRCADQLFAVAILDLRLHGRNGIELLRRIRQAQPGIRTIIHTAYGSFDSAKDAVNLGAFAYVEKHGYPIELISQVHRAVEDRLSEALSESEQRYRELLDDVVAIVWECELPSRRFTFVSQHAKSILGYSIRQWLDQSDFWVKHIHADDREQCLSHCIDRAKQGCNYECDYRMIAADGTVVWMRDTVRIVNNEAGVAIGLRGVLIDITEKMRAEFALRESESRYRSLIEDTPVCIHEIDLDGCLTSINPTGLKMLRVANEAELVGINYLSFVGEADRDRIETLMRLAFNGEASSFEFGCNVRGQKRRFASNFIPVFDECGAVIKLMGTSEDVTDRRASEASLRESERSLAEAQRIARMGSWQFDLASGQLAGSAELLRIIGLDENEPIPSLESFFNDFVHLEDFASLNQSYQHALNSNETEGLEFRLTRRSDQAICHVRAESQMICGPDGFPEKIIGTLQDISEQKKVELAPSESEQKFRVLSERSPTIVLIVRLDRIVYANPILATVTGYSINELMNMDLWEITHPEYREIAADRHRRRLNGENVARRYELGIVTKNGEDRWLDVSAELIEFEGDSAALVTCVNVTDRILAEQQLHEMESQLAHVSRLSTMGEMVAGIAHEINQPLAAISNFAAAASKAIEAIESDLPIDSWLQQISQQAVRCGEIIRRLRSFVKKGDQQWEWVDLNSVIRESIALIGSDVRHPALIECRLPNTGPQVFGSKVQLQQVLVNLIRNACDATNEHTNPEICIKLDVCDGTVRLTVEDNGPGVDQDQRDQLFDAFFTTKPNGMGIGLAISKSIIEKHQGSLRLDPGTTSGARFHVNLPERTVAAGQ